MNSIKAIIDKSDYEIYDDFLNINIDNKFLDEYIDEIYPNEHYKGLIPTLLIMDNVKETKIVNERILPEDNKKTLCPILMCPDDRDFSCTIIIVEIENKNNEIILWNKIGIDINDSKTLYDEPEKIGIKVNWFTRINKFEFNKNEYEIMINKFKSFNVMDQL